MENPRLESVRLKSHAGEKGPLRKGRDSRDRSPLLGRLLIKKSELPGLSPLTALGLDEKRRVRPSGRNVS